MKKLLIAVSLMFISVLGYSQQDQITETERIIDKYGDKIVSGFNSTVEKVAPMAEEGFKVAVRLQIAKGIACFLFVLLTVVVCFFAYKTYNISYKNGGDKDILEGKYGSLCVILFIISVLGLLGSIIATYNGILYLIAPEWHALKDIIELL